MHSKTNQLLGNRRRLLTSGTFSLFLHSTLLLVLVLFSVQNPIPRIAQTELLSVERDLGDRVVNLDVAIPGPQEEAPAMVDMLGAMSESAMEIESPVAELASGATGEGLHHTSAGAAGQSGGGQRRASFFGTQAEGDHFAYVLDVSGSMGDGSNRRYRRAVDEVVRSVEALNENQFFHVVLFSNRTIQMYGNNQETPEMYPANSANKKRLGEWLRRITPRGGTFPQNALRIALELKPSAIFFLSDGAFSKRGLAGDVRKFVITSIREGRSGARFLEPREVILELNKDGIPIHSVAFEDPTSSKDMQAISEMTDGVFRFIAATARPPTRLEERTAKRWVTAARRLLDRGRLIEANKQFAKVLRDFPLTEAAGEVRARQPELFAAEEARANKHGHTLMPADGLVTPRRLIAP